MSALGVVDAVASPRRSTSAQNGEMIGVEPDDSGRLIKLYAVVPICSDTMPLVDRYRLECSSPKKRKKRRLCRQRNRAEAVVHRVERVQERGRGAAPLRQVRRALEARIRPAALQVDFIRDSVGRSGCCRRGKRRANAEARTTETLTHRTICAREG